MKRNVMLTPLVGGAQGDLVAPAGGKGLVGWTLEDFHRDERQLRVTRKSRRWRDGEDTVDASNSGLWRASA